MIGTRIAHYEIRAHLGSGGMGDVYQASDTKLNREVAIKVLPEIFAHDAGRMTRFEREAKVLASLNHPNIAHIYGVEERALVMELAQGESPKGPMPFDEAWKIALQVADALEYAHEQGVIHRDLKPANIKVTPDGVVKLLDFGLAKAFRDTPDTADNDPSNSPTMTYGATGAGVILGTAAYMAPEQAKGKRVDKRADIWSWGVVLYELLTGERMFKGDDAADTIVQVLTKEPDLERVPSQVRKLLRRCLEKDPKQRLRDIGEARHLLEPPAAFAIPAASHSRFGIVVAAAMALIALWLGFGWLRATRSVELPLIRISADVGVRSSDRVAPEITFSAGQPGTLFALSPDGTRLAAGILDRDGKVRLAIRRLDQSEFVPVLGTESMVSPFFSPDGEWIAFFADGKLKKVAVQGGAPIVLCDSGLFPAGSWGDDGNIIAELDIQGGLSQVPSGGGAGPRAVTELKKDEIRHRYPQVLPGAQAVLFTVDRGGSVDDATVEVFSFKTHERKILVHGGRVGRYVETSKGRGHLLYVHKNTLLAAPFDLGNLTLTGVAQPVLNDVFQGSRYDFDVSKNGILVYVSGRDEPPRSIFWLDSTGKTQPLHPAPGYYRSLRFSPDGKQLAFASDDLGQNNVWVQDLNRDTSVRVGSQPGTNDSPLWTPDGKYIVFDSYDQPNPGIYWTRADGSGEPQRLAESGKTRFPSSFAPRGTRLAGFDIGRGFATDIWTAAYEGDPDHPRLGKRDLFLRTPAGPAELPTFAMPAFSPNGRWIAYCSGETGESEVYVNAFPSGKKQRISNSGGTFPIWSSNGREMFFVGPDKRINVVEYTTNDDSFLPTKPRVWSQQQILFNLGGGPFQPYDLAQDGKHFAVILYPNRTAEQQSSPHLTFMLNFFDELRRRVPLNK